MEMCESEPPGKAGGYEVIGEGRIAADVGMILFGDLDVGEIFVRVPLERDRSGNRKREVTFCNKQTWFDVKCVTGTAPAVTVPDEVFHRHAFEAAAEAHRDAIFRPENITES